jgi:hypothetical protein
MQRASAGWSCHWRPQRSLHTLLHDRKGSTQISDQVVCEIENLINNIWGTIGLQKSMVERRRRRSKGGSTPTTVCHGGSLPILAMSRDVDCPPTSFCCCSSVWCCRYCSRPPVSTLSRPLYRVGRSSSCSRMRRHKDN